ncbi:MAG TPA: phosphatase PAP2 family protein [Methylophilaceae bacterium]|nr:phosphatase PAP2 family protein [Methylophilaceae bacterium]
MDFLDIAVIQFVNSFARKSVMFDRIVLEILQLNSLKMMPLVVLMVWLWFSSEQHTTRKAVFSGFFGGFIALVMTRIVQNLGFHRPRPALSGNFDFVMPAGGYTSDWSSFPSDTAGLAFAMALGIWLASRKIGIAAFFWATIIISFPRLYGGFHYLSDLMAGAIIGMACTYLFWRLRRVSDPLFNTALNFQKNHKPWFYALAFIMAFQTSTYFGDVRKAGEKILHSIGAK